VIERIDIRNHAIEQLSLAIARQTGRGEAQSVVGVEGVAALVEKG
jgi:hypothetical protein